MLFIEKRSLCSILEVIWMRSSFEIIAEILETAKNGAKKTRIMYSCGLSYIFVQKYLDLLLQTGLLCVGNSYHTTDKGKGFLRKYRRLDLLMKTRN
jgi:predicted transcriptional regulator